MDLNEIRQILNLDVGEVLMQEVIDLKGPFYVFCMALSCKAFFQCHGDDEVVQRFHTQTM